MRLARRVTTRSRLSTRRVSVGSEPSMGSKLSWSMNVNHARPSSTKGIGCGPWSATQHVRGSTMDLASLANGAGTSPRPWSMSMRLSAWPSALGTMTWPCGQCLVSAPSSDAAFAADDRSVTPSVGPTTTTTTPPSRVQPPARGARVRRRGRTRGRPRDPRGSGGVSARLGGAAPRKPLRISPPRATLPAPVRVADEDDTSRRENSQEPSNPTREGHNERRPSGGEAAPSPRWVPPPERRTRSARGRADSLRPHRPRPGLSTGGRRRRRSARGSSAHRGPGRRGWRWRAVRAGLDVAVRPDTYRQELDVKIERARSHFAAAAAPAPTPEVRTLNPSRRSPAPDRGARVRALQLPHARGVPGLARRRPFLPRHVRRDDPKTPIEVPSSR